MHKMILWLFGAIVCGASSSAWFASKTQAQESPLEGYAWYGDCRQTSVIWGKTSDLMLGFKNDQLFFTLSDFGDEHCKEPLISMTAQGTFQLSNASGPQSLDYKGQRLLVTINSTSVMTMFETVCGRGFFKIDEERDVTGEDCNGVFAQYYTAATSRFYTVLQFEQSSITLALPQGELDGSDPTRRPKEPNASFPFKVPL